MELALLDLLERQIAIDDEDCHIESLWPQTELPVHIYDPFDQKSSARVLNFIRQLHFRQVVSIYFELGLHFPHVLVNITGKLGHHLWVPDFELV